MENKEIQEGKGSSASNIIFINLSKDSLPVFTENKRLNIMNYGKENDYPNILLDKFNRSAKHGAIIKQKAYYIAGAGFQFDDAPEDTPIPVVNRYKENINAIAKKCALDIELYGGCYLEIIWTTGGTISDIVHVDYHKVRSSENNEQFYIKDDWSKSTPKPEPIEPFNPDKRSGKQILYYKEYRPGINTYTLPEYVQAMTYIEADIAVSEHVLNNAQAGFTGSKMIIFTDGEPSQEEQKKIERDIKRKFSGETGTKIMVSFSRGKDQTPVIEDLGSSDLTKEDFTRVDELIQSNIFSSHGVTSPMLFGIKSAGQLGGTTELKAAFDIFKNTYVTAKQKNLNELFAPLLEINKLKPMKLGEVKPIGLMLSESTVAQNMSGDEIRELFGLQPREVEQKSDAQKTIEAINSLSPLVANKVLESLTEEELRGLVGLGKAKGPTVGSASQKEQFSADDAIAVYAEFGRPKADFTIVKAIRSVFSRNEALESENEFYQTEFKDMTELDVKIAGVIKDDKRATPEVIAKALKITVGAVNKALTRMEEKGYIKTKTETRGTDKQITRTITDKILKAEVKELDYKVHVMYSYEWSPNVPSSQRTPSTSREFCQRLMELDKIYSRGDIEKISQRLGYSAWERRGGFYNNPNTGETTPYCRHIWQQQIVIEKRK